MSMKPVLLGPFWSRLSAHSDTPSPRISPDSESSVLLLFSINILSACEQLAAMFVLVYLQSCRVQCVVRCWSSSSDACFMSHAFQVIVRTCERTEHRVSWGDGCEQKERAAQCIVGYGLVQCYAHDRGQSLKSVLCR